jgi:hypothetical protein
MNKWGIPAEMEKAIIDRDQNCSYCRCQFSEHDKKTTATWEHITNDARIISYENICRCCFSCNASKGSKLLSEWLESSYCKKKGISLSTVSDVIKNAFRNPPSLNLDKASDDKERHLDEILQSNMSDDDLASETWVLLSGEDLLLLRKTIKDLKSYT